MPRTSKASSAPRPRKAPARKSATHRKVSAAARKSRAFPIVGVGASAGGLEAISALLAALPAEPGMAFVIVSHLDRTHASMLDTLLSKKTAMPVTSISDGIAVESNHVYVVPPDKFVTIQRGMLHTLPRSATDARPTVIDQFFASLARDQRAQARGVVLSGIGSDGTQGLKLIRMSSGVTYAQDPATAQFDGMPSSAIRAGCADFVLAPAQIAARLLHPGAPGEGAVVAETRPVLAAIVGDRDFAAVLGELLKCSGIDFSQYKPTTLRRRIARRMATTRHAGMAAYARHLRAHPEETQALYEDVLIHVSNFFRDDEAFRALQRKVIAPIASAAKASEPIRVWVPGCACGEEVYSIGMLLLETLGKQAGARRIQLFGTDVSAPDIDLARAGRYPAQIADQISPQRLKRFFVQVRGGYQVTKELRELCVFACQEVGSDPPFSRLDLISCRNLLIYFGRPLQNRVIETFHYALKPGGFLFLGRSESLAGHAHLFGLLDKKHRIYTRKPGARTSPQPKPAHAGGRHTRPAVASPAPGSDAELRHALERMLLDRYAPPGLFVDDDLQIRSFMGDVSPYLQPVPGQADLHLARLIAPGIALDIRTAIRAARKAHRPVRRSTTLVGADGRSRALVLAVIPVARSATQAAGHLVLFEPDTTAAGKAADSAAPTKSPRERSELVRLNRLLVSTREQLQTVIEEQEQAAQELRTAHEEVLSSNEELQSSNEELETSKEELQSANEELTTVNEELQRRNEELDELAVELSNLIAGVNIPIVNLDRARRVLRFSPAARAAFNLIDTDIGRPFAQIKPPLALPRLDALIDEAMTHDTVIEREAQDSAGRWHSLRVRPYKAAGGRAGGVLIALVDIDAAKRGAAAIVETIEQPILVLDSHFRVLTSNPAFHEAFRVSREETEGRPLFELGDGQWNLPELRTLLEKVLPQRRHIQDHRIEHVFPRIGHRVFLLDARQIVDIGVGTHTILLVFQDITAREANVAERLRAASEQEARRIARDLHDLFSGEFAALGIDLGRLARLPRAREREMTAGLRTAQQRFQELAQTAHDLARRLHSGVLEDLGLVKALRAECAGFERRHALPVRFRAPSRPLEVPADVALNLYRIAQEALRNVARHAHATRISVALTRTRSELHLEISDDGRGFDPDAAHRSDGLGLLSMAERSASVQGSFTVNARPGAGTTILVAVPLAAAVRPRKKPAP